MDEMGRHSHQVDQPEDIALYSPLAQGGQAIGQRDAQGEEYPAGDGDGAAIGGGLLMRLVGAGFGVVDQVVAPGQSLDKRHRQRRDEQGPEYQGPEGQKRIHVDPSDRVALI